MNTSILQKCVEELKKDSPKIDYILGMLETVIEMSGVPVTSTPVMPNTVYVQANGTKPIELTDEEKLAQVYGTGPIGGLK